jgi:hypothetical protein
MSTIQILGLLAPLLAAAVALGVALFTTWLDERVERRKVR